MGVSFTKQSMNWLTSLVTLCCCTLTFLGSGMSSTLETTRRAEKVSIKGSSVEQPRINLNHHNHSNGDGEVYFPSYGADPEDCERLASLEENLVNKLKAIREFQKVHDGDICQLYLSRYLQEYDEDAQYLDAISGNKKHKMVADNPVLSFKMVRRLHYSLLKDTMPKCRFREEITIAVENSFAQAELEYPNEHTVEELIHSLAFIQFVHGLNAAEDVRIGNLHDQVKTNLGVLLFDDCTVFAKHLLEDNYTHLGYQWIIAAEVSQRRKGFELESSSELEELWYLLMQKTGGKTIEMIHTEYQGKRVESLVLSDGATATYQGNAYCRGEKTNVIEQHDSYSICTLFDGIPYYRIGPLRVEDIVYKPFVFQFHNFVTDKEIEALKWQGEYTDNITETEQELLERFGNTAHDQNQTPVIKKLIWKIEALTNLKVAMNAKTGHIFYRGTYTPFGSLDNLDDLLNNTDKYNPQDMERAYGSLLIFISDVQLGGNEAFFKVGTFARPVKGSALFYYNVNLNNEAEDLVKHRTCPVILGVKEDIYVPLQYTEDAY